MHPSVLLCILLSGALAFPQQNGGYQFPVPSVRFDPGQSAQIGASAPQELTVICEGNQVLHFDGSCVEPEISRSIYLYEAPEIIVAQPRSDIQVPIPKLNYNVVFVRTPKNPEALEPIVVPPPQEKTVIYVLATGEAVEQKVIEVSSGPQQKPEVYYVNYAQDSNLDLPIGIDLRSAIETAQTQQGTLLEGESAPGATGAEFGSVGAPLPGAAQGPGTGFQRQQPPTSYGAPVHTPGPVIPPPQTYSGPLRQFRKF